ncbi:uncharacterized protein TNCT_484661 [Trichonephila clavata]|uniref:Uncharacterized protein n=1 Tax=Trichonephila clavata TaxID=2740835 RepID=A0A8X6JMB9_TRICU|nr:uncharacterized protein TNCT_484661 [Trichonephila clavata]
MFNNFKFYAIKVKAVVDTSSILEHREELRDLWEKRMMADDNQSSPSSTVAEKPSIKPSQEEGKEEMVAKINSESETKPDHQMSNGFAKSVDSNDTEESNANHIEEVDTKVHIDEKALKEEVKAHEEVDVLHQEKTKAQENEAQQIQKVDADHDNNNSVDSLEVDNTDDYVEEKTYTSELETSLVMKQPGDATNEVEVHSAKTEEQIPEQPKEKESVMEEPVIATSESDKAEEVDVVTKAEEPIATATTTVEEQPSSTEKVTTEIETITQTSEKVEVHEEVITSKFAMDVTQHAEEKSEMVSNENQIKTMEIEQNVNEDDDGFVRVEECLPKVKASETDGEVTDASKETVESIKSPEEQEAAKSNEHEIHSEATPAASTPEPNTDDKPNNPEIEQFVKSGGVKRILPGVQKTEQPYSTCTTETKIAMEIREMREREEELRIMREQSLLSPVVSPVPPKSPLPRSPSPSVKEGSSPTPTGCGYRVSSVFGHKGTTSPSPTVVEEEKKPFKGFSKESTVEKEIRLARDREEELRKQKGLPPREDDSYVKPSQVKSSQVRVFGKMAGTGNNSVKQAATAKIQMEIEEQTQREMALRETGSIRTISQERTDAKVAKLNASETTATPATNGQPIPNGNGYSNGRSSPDVAPYKRGSPSPTGSRPATIFSQTNGKGNISMHKFIASKGKETTFTAPGMECPRRKLPLRQLCLHL